MTANHHFIADDYLRAFDLKELFTKHTVIYSNLHYPSEPLSSQNRNDLTLQLEAAMNEMTLLVLRMKEPKPDSGEYRKYFPNPPATFRTVQERRVVN